MSHTFKNHGDMIEINGQDGLVITSETSVDLWRTIHKAIEKHGSLPVLVDTKVAERRMSVTDAHHSGSTPFEQGIRVHRVAFYLHGMPPVEVTEHFKTVASNRGTTIEFFSSREQAIAWLLN